MSYDLNQLDVAVGAVKALLFDLDEFNRAGFHRVQSVVAGLLHVRAGQVMRAALANDNFTHLDGLVVVYFYAEAFRSRITA